MKHQGLCPDCKETKSLMCPFDTFYIPAEKQELMCQDCIETQAEKQEEEKYQNQG